MYTKRENEEEEEEEEEQQKIRTANKRRKQNGRKGKNIPQCTRCNERAAWKHDKKGKRWFCKHCKLPFTPGVVPLHKPKKEASDIPACGRCGNTVGWRHDKQRNTFFCKKCRRPFRPDEGGESDEELTGNTSSDSKDRERGREGGRESRRENRNNLNLNLTHHDEDDRESFLDYDASKILMALKSDRLFEGLSSSD